ncbi:hypothetical protein ATN84_04980 [Paramesorhizobium deserti]|uniref:Uncharacterized protein n=1 Tax=Paramesorhizobium deserti TaxID=1494590 RepID=A0A135I102_9HYPH|nr:hypothetical protein ATN84_04980 [Paramesorhizobium deserti]
MKSYNNINCISKQFVPIMRQKTRLKAWGTELASARTSMQRDDFLLLLISACLEHFVSAA